MAGVPPLAPPPLNPAQQALYTQIALQNATPPITAPQSQGIPTFQGPTVNVPPSPPPRTPSGMPAPNPYSAIQAFQQPSIAAPDTTQLPAIPVPGQPGQFVPSTAQTQSIVNQYPDAPAVQSAMENLSGDRPQYQAPTYHPPNKWAMIATALAGLAFPGSPFSRFAAGFGQGEVAGAEAKYAREQKAAENQYASEVDQQSADAKQAQLAIQFTDAQASIAEKRRADEIRAEATQVRLDQGWARIDQGAERIGLDQARLKQQYALAQQRMQVAMRGQDITAHDKVLDVNTRLLTSQITQLGQNRRAMLNANVRVAVAGAAKVQNALDQKLIGLREQLKKGMKPEDFAAAVSQAEAQAHDQVTGLLNQGTTGTDLDKIGALSTNLDQGVLEDDMNEVNAYGAGVGGTGYAAGNPGTPPVTINLNTGGQGGNLYGGTMNDPQGYGFLNNPLYGQAPVGQQSTGQKGSGILVGEGTHAQRQAAATAQYQQQLGAMGANAGLGGGRGLEDATFKNAREYASQHAADFPTVQSLLHAMQQENPQTASLLSGPQVTQLIETWAHTRRGQGLPVNIAPPPGQTGGQEGGFGQPGVKEGPPAPNAPAAHKPGAAPQRVSMETPPPPGPQPTVGETVVAAAQHWGIPPQLAIAIMKNESSGNSQAISPTGAVGFMQLEPGTASDLGVDPHNPYQNIYGGVRYLRGLIDRFHSIPLAVAAYNAGPGAVQKYRGVPPFAETQTYVARVLRDYQSLMRQPAGSG